MMSRKNSPSRASFVSPPPSAEKTGTGGTELDAALAHLRPQVKRLLPHLPARPAARVEKAANP